MADALALFCRWCARKLKCKSSRYRHEGMIHSKEKMQMKRRFWNLTLDTLFSATYAAYIPAAISWTFDPIIPLSIIFVSCQHLHRNLHDEHYNHHNWKKILGHRRYVFP